MFAYIIHCYCGYCPYGGIRKMVPKFEIEYHLYELRMKAGLSDRGLSELSGISKTQINQIEDGKANPTLHTICILSLALGVTPADLFSIRITP